MGGTKPTSEVMSVTFDNGTAVIGFSVPLELLWPSWASSFCSFTDEITSAATPSASGWGEFLFFLVFDAGRACFFSAVLTGCSSIDNDFAGVKMEDDEYGNAPLGFAGLS